jgi:hypothetical protein
MAKVSNIGTLEGHTTQNIRNEEMRKVKNPLNAPK